MNDSHKAQRPITRTEICEYYRATVGLDGAKKIMSEIAAQLGIGPGEELTGEETAAVLEALKTRGKLVRIVALNITTRLVVAGRLSCALADNQVSGSAT